MERKVKSRLRIVGKIVKSDCDSDSDWGKHQKIGTCKVLRDITETYSEGEDIPVPDIPYHDGEIGILLSVASRKYDDEFETFHPHPLFWSDGDCLGSDEIAYLASIFEPYSRNEVLVSFEIYDEDPSRMSEEDIVRNDVFKQVGRLEASMEYEIDGWSAYTIEYSGLTDTTVMIGEHSLNMALKEHVGKYVVLNVSVFK